MARSGFVGRKAHAARLKKLTDPDMVREVGKALFAAGEIIQVDAQISITSGSVSGAKHVPSAPGQPPNQDTGHLAGNIETSQVAPLAVEVSSNASYSAALEFGSSEVAARPFMTPARNKNLKKATALVQQAVNRVVKRSRPTGAD